MNNFLWECKKKALTIIRSDQAPRKENGRKKGYMCIMKELWDDSEYGNLQLTEQNLRDQASRLEKTLGNVTEVIVNNSRRFAYGRYTVKRIVGISEQRAIFYNWNSR